MGLLKSEKMRHLGLPWKFFFHGASVPQSFPDIYIYLGSKTNSGPKTQRKNFSPDFFFRKNLVIPIPWHLVIWVNQEQEILWVSRVPKATLTSFIFVVAFDEICNNESKNLWWRNIIYYATFNSWIAQLAEKRKLKKTIQQYVGKIFGPLPVTFLISPRTNNVASCQASRVIEIPTNILAI